MPLSAVVGLSTFIGGEVGKGRARDEARAKQAQIEKLLKEVKPYDIPSEYMDMLSSAEYGAQYGMDPSTMQFQKDSLSQNITGNTQAILQSGGSPNDFSSLINDVYFTGLNKLAMNDYLLHMDKINKVNDAKQNIANQKVIKQEVNEKHLLNRVASLGAQVQGLNLEAGANKKDAGTGLGLLVSSLSYGGEDKILGSLKSLFGGGGGSDVANPGSAGGVNFGSGAEDTYGSYAGAGYA